MAINEKLLDELLGDRDPNEVFSKDGLRVSLIPGHAFR